jgi:hypothetical protein
VRALLIDCTHSESALCRYTFSKFELVGEVEIAFNNRLSTIRVTTAREVRGGHTNESQDASLMNQSCLSEAQAPPKRQRLNGEALSTDDDDPEHCEEIFVDSDDNDGGLLFVTDNLIN